MDQESQRLISVLKCYRFIIQFHQDQVKHILFVTMDTGHYFHLFVIDLILGVKLNYNVALQGKLSQKHISAMPELPLSIIDFHTISVTDYYCYL